MRTDTKAPTGRNHHINNQSKKIMAQSLSKVYVHITLLEYIDNQREHHKKQTFQQELLKFLRKYNVEYDERYLWD